MKWNDETWQKFGKTMENTPEIFKSVAFSTVKDQAEVAAKDRGASVVEDADLVAALWSATPKTFQAQMVRDAGAAGLDIGDNRISRSGSILSWQDIEKVLHPDTLHFLFSITDRCDQNCLHCSVDANNKKRPDLDTGGMKRVIDNCGDALQQRGIMPVFNFCGGEPLMNKDLFNGIEYNAGKGYLSALATDGTFINQENARLLKDLEVQLVFVSLDSLDKKKCDWLRGTKGAVDKAVKAINLLRDAGLFVVVSMVAMKPNIDEMEAVRDFVLNELGVFFYVFIMINAGRAAKNWHKIGLQAEEYQKFYHHRYGKTLALIRSGEALKLPAMEMFDMVPFMEHLHDEKEKNYLAWGVGCQSCRHVLAIDTNGDIYPCKWTEGPLLGNAFGEDFARIMDSELFLSIKNREKQGKCAGCEHLELCGGGCMVDAYKLTGDYRNGAPYCWHEPH